MGFDVDVWSRFYNAFRLIFSWGPRWIAYVLKNGRPATAVALGDPSEIMKGLGGYEGEDKWIDMQARVEPPDGAPYEAKVRLQLSQAMFGRITAGTRVNVKYDPEDRSRVVLVDDVQALLAYRMKKE